MISLPGSPQVSARAGVASASEWLNPCTQSNTLFSLSRMLRSREYLRPRYDCTYLVVEKEHRETGVLIRSTQCTQYSVCSVLSTQYPEYSVLTY